MLFYKTTDYAIRILCCLAKANRPVSSSKLASQIGISSRYLLHTSALLKNSGLVEVVNGSAGGYLPGRDPEQISVWDVVMATDTHFFTVLPNEKDDENRLSQFYRDTYEMVKCRLQQTTILDFLV